MLEAQVETLEQAQRSSATLVEDLQRQLEEALRRVADLEATVGHRQQWASSSARKSPRFNFSTDLRVPFDGIRDRSVFLVDATLRGIRNALVSYKRCSVH